VRTSAPRSSGRTFLIKLLIKSGVGEIHIFLIHTLFGQRNGFAKALEMDDFALAQEADDIIDIRIVR